MIKPEKLQKGDTIGIVAPSASVAAFCPRRLQRGVKELEKHGFKVKLGKHASEHYRHTAGTVSQRVEDLHTMFRDDEIKAIICTIGGHNSNQLLEHLDYNLIKQNPKILIGYSDITALLNAIYTKTDLITYLGPALLPQFGECGGTFPYTWKYFERTLMQNSNVAVEDSQQWTDEFTPWDEGDNLPREMKSNDGSKTLKPGVTSGIVIGGNLGTFLLLNGTPYMPNLEGKILCVEEDEVESPATVDRLFTQLRHTGAFEKINGMIIGRFHSKVGFSEKDPLEDIIFAATEGYDLPILYDVDFGHTDPMITIPIGGQSKLDATNKKIIFHSSVNQSG